MPDDALDGKYERWGWRGENEGEEKRNEGVMYTIVTSWLGDAAGMGYEEARPKKRGGKKNKTTG